MIASRLSSLSTTPLPSTSSTGHPSTIALSSHIEWTIAGLLPSTEHLYSRLVMFASMRETRKTRCSTFLDPCISRSIMISHFEGKPGIIPSRSSSYNYFTCTNPSLCNNMFRPQWQYFNVVLTATSATVRPCRITRPLPASAPDIHIQIGAPPQRHLDMVCRYDDITFTLCALTTYPFSGRSCMFTMTSS
eukprot:TRINITY_DN2871_c0_g1_i4.p1 TRINITY_DN2871_c0_g1~~TRINITY_DN2871_c0_g1_i4.p1  ORF type:complete len:190 (-),score=13.75 TRINITY_DN2871_c0_g1_i4:577-1146(-)